MKIAVLLGGLPPRISGVLNSAEQTWTNIINRSGCPARVENSLQFRVLREDMLWWAE